MLCKEDEWGNITHNAVLKCGERELDLVKTGTGHEKDSVYERRGISMTMIYKWECDNSIKDILEYLETNLDRKKYRLHIHEKEIHISFPLSKEFNRYYFKGKLKEKNDKVELCGVFSVSPIMNHVLLVLSVGFFFLILCDLLPISLVDIFFIMFFGGVLVVGNLIFYFITISCHNWSLYFWEDREKFLKILDKYLVRKNK